MIAVLLPDKTNVIQVRVNDIYIYSINNVLHIVK